MIATNAPESYVCPICLGIAGVEGEQTLLRREDAIYSDDIVTVFINSFFVGNNPGHAIVVPNEHHESLYDIPDNVGHRIFELSKKVAIAMKKSYGCDGITIRQNNEPAGDQHAFHYHLHVFPRYDGDGFNQSVVDGSQLADPSERATYAKKLSDALEL